MKYVIIGNSAAAIGAVEGIRQVDKNGSITIISNESHHTYSRPLISYLIYGKTTQEKMLYRSKGFYEKNECEFIYANAEKIDATAKTVLLNNGQSVSYDKLLVATGSRPFIPPMQGLENVEKKFTFMSLDDALGLQSAITPDSRVLIVGAGLIGLKAAEGIYNKVKSITVIDLADRILPSILDIEGSTLVQKHIESKGIRFYLNDSASEFSANTATLKSGLKIDFDILIIAVGVRANTQLVQDAGGEVKRGISTDSFCATTLKDIYAAGDCSESFDITTSENKVLALLPNAYMQGECAGINMAGGSKEYLNAIPMNAIGFFGLHIITAGSFIGDTMVTQDEECYRKLIIKDGLLKGVILIGDVKRAGIYTSIIRDQIPLDTVDFEMLKEKPQLLAFSKAARKQKLGGVEK